MFRALVVSAFLVGGLCVATAARADGCTEGELVLTEDGFRVCGEAARPHAMYVLPRARGERYVPELRRSTTSEIVRDADSL